MERDLGEFSGAKLRESGLVGREGDDLDGAEQRVKE
jgi:hypothetical protein